jgi:hypothetical protein
MTENTIEPTDSHDVPTPTIATPGSGQPAKKTAQADLFSALEQAAADTPQPAVVQKTQVESTSALVALRSKLKAQYLVDNDKYYLRDDHKTLAFEDKGLPFRRLVTHLDKAEVARSMVELAKAKGWLSIKVDGSESFKRKVWVEAQLHGLSITGYASDAFDQVTLKERQAIQVSDARSAETVANSTNPARVDPAGDEFQREPEPHPQTTALFARSAKLGQALHKALLQAGIAAESDEFSNAMDYVADLAASPRAYVGTLLDHGNAPYEFKEKAGPSYYIKLQTESGEKIVWGVDLPRAIAEQIGAAARTGDAVLLAFRGAQSVDVQDAQSGQTVQAVRNTWYFERVSELPQVAASSSIKPSYSPGAPGVRQVSSTAPPSEREKVLIDVLASKGAPEALIKAVRAQVATSTMNVIPTQAMHLDRSGPTPRPSV